MGLPVAASMSEIDTRDLFADPACRGAAYIAAAASPATAQMADVRHIIDGTVTLRRSVNRR
jgi:hypothetical protein